MDPRRGPIGDAREVFQTNFAFGRAAYAEAQYVHAGLLAVRPPGRGGLPSGPDLRYSEVNLNRIQIAGELPRQERHRLSPRARARARRAARQQRMLYDEASWEDRGQMGRTSARDLVEAVLLDVHFIAGTSQAPPPRQGRRTRSSRTSSSSTARRRCAATAAPRRWPGSAQGAHRQPATAGRML